MTKVNFLVLFVILSILLNGFSISGQTIYDEQDDSDVWPGQCQNGGMQSPINLVISKASYTNQYALHYEQYDESIGKVQLKNDGKTVYVIFKNDNFNPAVTFSGEEYLLEQFHFHWGGSEHEFNGKRLDGEIHLVHLSKQNDILVLGALLQKSDNIENLISYLFRVSNRNIQPFNTTVTVDLSSSTLRDLLTNVNLFKYLTYEGSLTTPDCDEGVRWIVYHDIIQVDAQAIEGLKQLENEKGNKILFNYRNIQPLNGRTVYKTFSNGFFSFIPNIF